jgi:hypothetical protein
MQETYLRLTGTSPEVADLGASLPRQEKSMFSAASRLALLALVGLLGPATSAVAQKVSLSPTIGVYIPTTELVKAASGDEFKQEVGLAVGGRLGVNFSPRFGILTSVTYVPSDLKLDLASGQQVKDKANLLFGTARATLYVLPVTAPVWLSLNGGGSYVRRSGDAYEGVSDRDDIGAVVGATLGFNLGGLLSFYVAADDYVYGTRLETTSQGPTLGETRKTQNDVQLAIGFGVPLGGR